MKSILTSQPAENRNPNDFVVMNLWLKRSHDVTGLSDWKVDKVVMTGDRFVNTIDLKSVQSIDTVLSSEFRAFVSSYLPTTLDQHILTASGLVFETEGLTLQSLRVTGFKLAEGLQRVLLTFKRAFGSVMNLFQPASQPSMMREAQAGLSTRVLADILDPALNLIDHNLSSLPSDTDDRAAKLVDQILQKKRDLQLYLSLITRYVARLDR